MTGTARVNNTDLLAPPVAQTIRQRSLIVGVTFAVMSIIGAIIKPDEFFPAYLLGFMAWLGVTLGCMAILMLQYMTGGAWGMVIRRILEAGTRTLPLLVLLFVPILFGLPKVYVWARPAEIAEDKHLQEITHAYLNFSGFLVRAIIYFTTWSVLVYFLNRWSAEQDNPMPPDINRRFRVLSGPGLVLYGFSMSFAAIDWVMSLSPHWISTIYPLIFLAGQVLSALGFVVAIETILFRYKPVSELLKPEHVHDHGKLILTFVMLWAYFSFSQWLIIWAGNLPEEISWFVRRLNGWWGLVGLFLAAFHFAVPFVLLLSRQFKRNVRTLVWLAVWLMFMRLVDLFWMIEPTFHPQLHVTVWDIVVPIGIGGLWLAYFFRNLKGRPLLPLHDPHSREILKPAHE
ncbi:MAG: hypothetical protein AUH86_09450 [Acidobacteria bacterium 13_1_40CM_4_58_4]|nr:MAG: hypothetical protein AUH86_09450 [Acidobacteria bacterium 13_1_40CM_4_58_4]